jgi:hypothetical protein
MSVKRHVRAHTLNSIYHSILYRKHLVVKNVQSNDHAGPVVWLDRKRIVRQVQATIPVRVLLFVEMPNWPRGIYCEWMTDRTHSVIAFMLPRASRNR